MVIRNVTVNDCTPETIVIGRRGTYETMQVVFDLTYLIENYGDGTAVLALKRSQDSSAYPAVAAQDGNTLTWVVSDVDTYYVGAGVCQLMWYVDDGLAKTIIYQTVVMKDILSTAEEPPDGYKNWIEHLTDLGAETLQNAQDAEQSASEAEQAKDDAVDAKESSEEAARKAEAASVHAPIIYGGYWYIWNNGQYVATGVRAEGQKGDKGDTGKKGDTGNGISKIEKTGTSGLVDTYTVTYTDGTSTTFTVTNGAKGDKGDTGATGNGIQSITKTGTSGNVDTYTITYTNGQTTTFTVTNGAVTSVAGKTGAVSLDANDVAFSESGTYDDGTVGKELSNQKNAIGQLDDVVNDPVHGLAQKAPLIVNTASGEIANFVDGADDMPIKSLVASIEPVQDLHGYDSPWPGGGNINLFDKDYLSDIANYTNIVGSYGYTDKIQLKPNTAYIIKAADLTALSSGVYYVLYHVEGSDPDVINITNTSVTYPVYDGAVSSADAYMKFTTGETGVIRFGVASADKLAEVMTKEWQLQEGSTATSWTPYANICPISGYDGVNVNRTGKNLLPNLQGTRSPTSIYIGQTDGTTYPISLKANQDYTISFNATGTNVGAFYKTATSGSIGIGTSGSHFRVNEDCDIQLWLYSDNLTAVSWFQLEVGTTASEYEAYTGTTIPITFPTTIYGGSDEVIGGALVDNRFCFTATPDLTYFLASSTETDQTFYIRLSNNGLPTGVAGTCISNVFSQMIESGSGRMVQTPTDIYFVLSKSIADSIETLKAWLANNSVVFSYQRATPIEYTLTATELATLYGQNNVWTDVGEVSVDYPADTKLYIDNKIATAVANALNA